MSNSSRVCKFNIENSELIEEKNINLRSCLISVNNNYICTRFL